MVPVLVVCAVCTVVATRLPAEEANTAIEARLRESANYLASDELEGRGLGTKGLDKAADYIAAEFKKMGLKTDLYDGTPFQSFEVTTGAKLGKPNAARLVAEEQTIDLKLDKNFTPMTVGGSGTFDVPVIFAGYGITAEKEQYDDYADLDVKDKAVIILRKEPQQGNPHSVFNGTDNSPHAFFERKISNAYQHGAAVVILVNDGFGVQESLAKLQASWAKEAEKLTAAQTAFAETKKPSVEQIRKHYGEIATITNKIKQINERILKACDPLMPFNAAGLSSSRNMPVLTINREVIDQVLKAGGHKSLLELEAAIDEGPKPQSFAISGWKLAGQTSVERTVAEVKNIIAVLEPREGPLADETIIIGAHYDHLGMGGFGSFVPNQKEVHNGADDNGSGTAALLEVARQIVAAGPQARRVVFMAFTAEERGLIGSAHYAKEPLFPLESTVAMLNMDMVGRLQDNKLIIQGVDTAKEFDQLIDGLNHAYKFEVTKKSGGVGPSDHATFYLKQIPVMHFFTGTHADYHRPSDDADKLNIEGMRRISSMLTQTALALAEADKRPEYVEVKGPERTADRGGDRPYFGSIPDFADGGEGYKLGGVTKEGPAAKAGIKAGDSIVKLGKYKIGNLEDFDLALRKFSGGDKVPVEVLRDGKVVKLEIILGDPR